MSLRFTHPPLWLSLLFALPALGQAEYECQAQEGQWVCQSRPTPLADDTGSTAAMDNPFYWVPAEAVDWQQLTPAQRTRLENGCCGVYLPPVRDDDAAEIPPTEAETHITGRGTITGDPREVVTIRGGAVITQGARRITADEIEIDEINQRARAEGDIEILEPRSLLVGDRALLQRDTGEVTLDNSQFILFDTGMRGQASRLHQDENGKLILTGGAFTQCEPGREHWLIRGSEITVDRQAGEGTAKHMRLELAGVPVFYFPYLSFPTGDKSKSGFLYPSFSSEDFPLPYYLALAPNYDMTITPRHIRDRGTALELEFRHLSPWFETIVGGAWLGNGEDDISRNERNAIADGELTETEATLFDEEDRWLASVQQTGGQGQRWFSRIDYTKTSDYAYFQHIDTANLDVNRATHLRQLGEVGYHLPNWQLSSRWEEFQTIVANAREPYRRKPQVAALGNYQWGDWSLNLSNEWVDWEAPDEYPNDPQGQRLRLEYEATWNKQWLWGFFKPTARLVNLGYQLDEQGLAATQEDDPNFTVPQGSLDMGLFFERDGSWLGSDYLQTFEPRVFYFYSDYEDQSNISNLDFDTSELTFSYAQLFRHTRFAGGDRIDDANRISVGLTSRFIGRASGQEKLRVSLGQIYHQEDRRVTLDGTPELDNRSLIAGQVSSQLTDSLRFSSDLLYDHQTTKITKGSASLRYYDAQQRIFNLGYRYNRRPPGGTAQEPENRDDSQGDLSLVLPVGGNWSLIARQLYDFTGDRELDTIGGLEYTSCCYRVRLMARRWLDNELINLVSDDALEYDRGIFIEFHLRGLGMNLGNRLGSALSDGIINYERREEAFLESNRPNYP